MKYLTYGDKNKRAVVLIHGMATSALQCYGAILDELKDYYVVLAEVDGHIPDDPETLVSLDDACSSVENYIREELDNEVWCLGGFSMGATMAAEIAGRNHVKIDKLFLDAAFLVRMGPVLTQVYKSAFVFFIQWIKEGKKVPGPLLDSFMGKGNRAIISMLYYGTQKETISNVCQYVYSYRIRKEISSFQGEALFIYGSNEPYPRRSAGLLASYMPGLKQKEIKDMGHGQFLHDRPHDYAKLLLDFLK